MIEVSNLEFALFLWASIATGFALKYQHDLAMAKFFLHKVITDETVRTELVESYKKFEQRNKA